MAYYQDHRYYRPTSTSYPPRFVKKKGLSLFQSLMVMGIGFFITYTGLIFTFERDKYLKSDIALPSASPTLVSSNETKLEDIENQSGSFNIGSSQTPLPSATPQTLGVNTQQNEELLKLIEEKLPNDNGEYAIVVKEVGGSEHQAFINHQTVYPSGSLYKLYVMAAALEKVEKGEWTMNTTVTGNASHLEEVLGSIDFGYESKRGKTISYTLEETLGRISRISDNYASIMLAEKLDWEYVRDYAKRIGANNTVIKSPISTTAEDTLHFFDLLYQKKIVSEKQSDLLIDLLSKAQLNQRIPAKLPKSKLKIAHKTGELPGVRHDAGIVFLEKTETNKGPYIIVLMSKDLKKEDSGIATLADVSKVVYDYFNKVD
jgi:beta-lactamase class A